MKINITTKNLELTDSLNLFIEKRLKSVDRIIGGIHDGAQEVFVEIEKETKHHRKGNVFSAEIIVQLPKEKIVCKADAEAMGKAITLAVNELKAKIKKHKHKVIELPRRKYRKVKKEMQ